MNAMGLLAGTAGVSGPFKVVAEYVRRTATRSVVVIALIPASLYTGQAPFRVDDTAKARRSRSLETSPTRSARSSRRP